MGEEHFTQREPQKQTLSRTKFGTFKEGLQSPQGTPVSLHTFRSQYIDQEQKSWQSGGGVEATRLYRALQLMKALQISS